MGAMKTTSGTQRKHHHLNTPARTPGKNHFTPIIAEFEQPHYRHCLCSPPPYFSSAGLSRSFSLSSGPARQEETDAPPSSP
mmetsp:Transcript_33576/g.54617  ORF Transcript_33576/g.54617 Transcript_33576/m.54617 type:complete len:81 (-) Transcript_33576:455-697(-)